MTLAFIGEWPEDISEILPAADQPFLLRLSDVGLFPEAKVIWAASTNEKFALCEILDGIGFAFSFLVKDEPILNLYDPIA